MLCNLPYTAHNDSLRTLDLWLPSSISGPEPVIFLIYLHGGAWTDPKQDSREGHTILKTLYANQSLLQNGHIKVAAASINYRLSTPGSDIKHPTHMNDVLTALSFLKRNYDMTNAVLIGHSAGATLAVQVFHTLRREIQAMVLFNGIYDLPALVDEYPEYNGFVSAAFGDLDRNDWTAPSPTRIMKCTDVKRENRNELFIIAHSEEDELLSMRQSDLFDEVMQKKWSGKTQRTLIHGKHDDSPHSVEMQRLCAQVVDKVAGKLYRLVMETEAAKQKAQKQQQQLLQQQTMLNKKQKKDKKG